MKVLQCDCVEVLVRIGKRFGANNLSEWMRFIRNRETSWRWGDFPLSSLYMSVLCCEQGFPRSSPSWSSLCVPSSAVCVFPVSLICPEPRLGTHCWSTHPKETKKRVISERVLGLVLVEWELTIENEETDYSQRIRFEQQKVTFSWLYGLKCPRIQIYKILLHYVDIYCPLMDKHKICSDIGLLCQQLYILVSQMTTIKWLVSSHL